MKYHDALDNITVKQQFYLFQTKQKINRNINEYIKDKNPFYIIFDILDADDFEMLMI